MKDRIWLITKLIIAPGYLPSFWPIFVVHSQWYYIFLRVFSEALLFAQNNA